ncbi:signal peptidase I [Catenovulum maritimum]|uniref:Signal peptidase I n=1 Tax=Catenovulum maritimum TaxID=1513271 RepID=A0A0J8GWY2_9ALTE|nr:signal peptidase I [Catenovulum maritimum]KMT65784.1 signal peptidase [Catenovulum maritimum]
MLKKFCLANSRFLIFMVLMFTFRSAIADWYHVPTGSMIPTIEIGDQVIVDKAAYDLRVPFSRISMVKTGEPDYNHIIVFESKAADTRLIKRVIGLPNDIVSMVNDQVYLNGKPLRLNQKDKTELLAGVAHLIQLDLTQPDILSSFPAVVVPEDHYLVLGDNRRSSADSRVYGFVPRHEIIGRATKTAFSLDYDKWFMPKSDRFNKPLV